DRRGRDDAEGVFLAEWDLPFDPHQGPNLFYGIVKDLGVFGRDNKVRCAAEFEAAKIRPESLDREFDKIILRASKDGPFGCLDADDAIRNSLDRDLPPTCVERGKELIAAVLADIKDTHCINDFDIRKEYFLRDVTLFNH